MATDYLHKFDSEIGSITSYETYINSNSYIQPFVSTTHSGYSGSGLYRVDWNLYEAPSDNVRNYANIPLTIESEGNDTSIIFGIPTNKKTTRSSDGVLFTLQVSTDNCETWQNVIMCESGCPSSNPFYYNETQIKIDLEEGQRVSFICLNLNGYAVYNTSNTEIANYQFSFGGESDKIVYGNILSIICGKKFKNYGINYTYNKENTFHNLFAGAHLVKSFENLVLYGNGTSCFSAMFSGSKYIEKAPKILPATILHNGCYAWMFHECEKIEIAPILPATDIAPYAYDNMFRQCKNLKYVKAMSITNMGDGYSNNWMSGVTTGVGKVFVKNPNATWNVTGIHGVPEGWEIRYS